MEPPKAEIVLTGLPPSLWQAYYQRRGGKGKCLTEKASAWKNAAILEARAAYRHKPLQGRLSVMVLFRCKSRGGWDIDNRYKLLLDAMTEAKVWGDDSKIDQLLGIVQLDGRLKKPETRILVWEICG